MLVQEKKRHRQGCGPYAYGDLAAGSLGEKDGKKIKNNWGLTVLPEASTLGRLMYVIPSASLTGTGLRSAREGSGVVIRKEEMYLVSAISSCSKIRSRSSTSRARRWVSLGQSLISRRTKRRSPRETYMTVKRLEISTSIPVSSSKCV